MKKARLFVSGEEATDSTAFYCGGPDAKDAKKGLANILEAHIEDLLSKDNGTSGSSVIVLTVEELTDEEVEQLSEY